MPLSSALQTSMNGFTPSLPRYGLTVAKSVPNTGTRMPSNWIPPRCAEAYAAEVEPLVSDEAGDAELLVHRDLRLDRRDEVRDLVDDAAVELPDRVRDDLELVVAVDGLLVPALRFLNEVLREKREARVETHDDGSSRLFNFFDEFPDH